MWSHIHLFLLLFYYEIIQLTVSFLHNFQTNNINLTNVIYIGESHNQAEFYVCDLQAQMALPILMQIV